MQRICKNFKFIDNYKCFISHFNFTGNRDHSRVLSLVENRGKLYFVANRLTGSKHVPFFNKRGGVNNFTVHTTEFLRTVNILFDQNKDSRIVMDKKEGTGWRGCRKRYAIVKIST